MPSGSATSIVARTRWVGSSSPAQIRTPSSVLRPVNSQAYAHRYGPISGRPSRPVFGSTTEAEERRLARMLMFFGHLRPGAHAREATTELNTLAIQMRDRSGSTPEASAPLVADAVGTLPNPGSRRLARTLSALMGAVVAVVLMIACVNVGHLLLARGALRQREFAVRRALGASRARLLRQLLTEALVLAVAGTLCGVVFALWAGKLLERSLPLAAGIFAIQVDLSLDWRALVFAAGICAVTTVLCGLLPAWRVSGMSGMLVAQGSVGASARRRPVGLVAQVVMSLVLLFIGASFVAALLRLHAMYPGFAVAGRLYAYTFLPSPPFAPDSRRGVVCTSARSVARASRCAPGRRHLIVAADSCRIGLRVAVSGLARARDDAARWILRTSRPWASSVSPGDHLSRATRPQTRRSSPRALRADSGQTDRLSASAS